MIIGLMFGFFNFITDMYRVRGVECGLWRYVKDLS